MAGHSRLTGFPAWPSQIGADWLSVFVAFLSSANNSIVKSAKCWNSRLVLLLAEKNPLVALFVLWAKIKRGGGCDKLEGNVRLLDPLIWAWRSMNKLHSVLKPTSPCILRCPEDNCKIMQLGADSVKVLQSYSCFLHPIGTPALHNGQTWVCMRFWSGRVRSEFCEEDWE